MFYDNRKACINCFNDPVIRELISNNEETGVCDWCDSEKVNLIHIFELSERFREVADCYVEVTGPGAHMNGDLISWCLQDDWNIFSKNIEEDCDLLREMTLAILVADLRPKDRVDFPNYTGFFRMEMSELEFEWFDKLELMLNGEKTDSRHTRGHGPDGFPDRIELAIRDRTYTYGAGKIYYRARVHKDRKRKERFALDEMGAPPPEDATAGRANRSKEPVLYLATDYKTALAEVRSWRGMAVAVAQVRIKQDIRVLDLIELHFPQSPFDSEYLCYDLQVIGLLQSFGSALSHPLLPGEEEKLYLPSQRLCEFVRQHGVEGILYPSAMGTGDNIVVFDPDLGEPISVAYYRIGTPDFSTETINNSEDIYDDWPYAHLVVD